MLGFGSIAEALAARPAAMASVSPEVWSRLSDTHHGGAHQAEFGTAWDNGQAFLRARDGLRGRRPLVVEWKGGHRATADETAPVDLRVDHVFLVSCKYRSQILHNSSPRALFDNLLVPGAATKGADWFAEVAPDRYQALYDAVRWTSGAADLPQKVGDLSSEARCQLGQRLKGAWPEGTEPAVISFTDAVARESAVRWRQALGSKGLEEVMLWRLLRIGGAPYFLLGSGPEGPVRLRIATPWDWRQQYRLRRFDVVAQPGGQPRVGWHAQVADLRTGRDVWVEGHVEVRWSHGRFAQLPEAKVYLDTPHGEVPGYYDLA
jgi:hypothetical protein